MARVAQATKLTPRNFTKRIASSGDGVSSPLFCITVYALSNLRLPRQAQEKGDLLLRISQDVDTILTTSPDFIGIERRTKWDEYRKV